MSALENGLESAAEQRIGYANPPVATRFLPGVRATRAADPKAPETSTRSSPRP
jgi:hypothetical protein